MTKRKNKIEPTEPIEPIDPKLDLSLKIIFKKSLKDEKYQNGGEKWMRHLSSKKGYITDRKN